MIILSSFLSWHSTKENIPPQLSDYSEVLVRMFQWAELRNKAHRRPTLLTYPGGKRNAM